jgi:hypothetical protein
VSIVKAVFLIAIGLVMIYGGGAEFLGWLRARSRLRRVPGVIIATEEVLGRGPAVRNRSGRFRFTTDQGRVIDKLSSFYSFPGPKVGKPVTVSYDPARPEKSAEIAWVSKLMVTTSSLIMAGGVACCAYGATLL